MSKAAGSLKIMSPEGETPQLEKQGVKNILGVDVRDLGKKDAFEFIEQSIEKNDHRKFAFLNAHGANIAYSEKHYRETLQKFDVFADGVGLDIGSGTLYGNKFVDNLNGTDFLPDLFNYLKKPITIGLLGGEEGVAEKAARALWERHSHHDFVAIHNGYFDEGKEEEILQCLQWFRPDILLVALGNPIQEKWIAENCTEKHATVTFGVGAFLDFASGKVQRAPDWVIKTRLEWFYRLSIEPRRMWRRYVVGNPLFIVRVLRQKLLGLPTGKPPRKSDV